MTKVEQLADVARGLTGQQIDGLIEYGRYLQAQPHYETASTEVLASIDRGLEDAMAGRVHSLEAVLARIDKKLDAGTS